MRKLQFVALLLLVLVLGMIGVGFYRDWFALSSSSDSETGRTVLQLTIEQEKIKADFQLAKEKVAGPASPVKDQPDTK